MGDRVDDKVPEGRGPVKRGPGHSSEWDLPTPILHISKATVPIEETQYTSGQYSMEGGAY